MKKLNIILISIFLALSFSACSSKAENTVLKSTKNDVSDLLSKLIEKEREINRLTQELEDCKNKKK